MTRLLLAVLLVVGTTRMIYAQPEVTVFQPADTRLSVIYAPKSGVTIRQAKQRYRDALVVCAANFYHRLSLSISGLLIIDGHCLSEPSRKINRPAIGVDRQGKIIFSTARRIYQNRNAYSLAFEAGPFGIVEGKDWHTFDFEDHQFFRQTQRVVIGQTDRGELFWATDHGTLRQVQTSIKNHLIQSQPSMSIRCLVFLDGGTSTNIDQRVPVLFAIFPKTSGIVSQR